MAAVRSHAPSLSRRFFIVLLAVSTAAVIVAFIASAILFQASGEADVRAALNRECDLIASALDISDGDDNVAIVRNLDLGGMRATLIDANGNVLMDSEGDASDMESHANRPEVQEALAHGEGSSERLSRTLDIVSFYHAKRLASGGVIRVAQDSRTAFSIITGDLSALALVAIIVIALSWLVARIISRVLVAPILAIDIHSGHREGDSEQDDANTTSPYHELEPLVERLHRQQSQLVEQMDQLRDAEVMRQEFTANITHELKTPLAVISGAAELIRDGIARPEDVANFAGRIYDESQRLTSLVNDILILSRLDESERAGMPDLVGSLEPCDLHSIAQDVCSRLAPMAKRANVTLGCVGMTAPVMGNARLLDELIYNLCSNAIRYNRENGSVVVTCGVGDPDTFEVGNGITSGTMSSANAASAVNAAKPLEDMSANASLGPFVRVADTGIGIDRSEQAKVFERFYRVDTSRSRNGGGTGLGLAIVKHSAAFHHAEIDLDSTPGEGTTITVTLPPASDYPDAGPETTSTEN